MSKARLATTLAAAVLLTACGFNAVPRDAASRQAAGFGARAAAVLPEPESRTILSPHFNERGEKAISTIVLHHTAMVETAVQTAEFFQRPNAKVSSHYIVDRSGELVRAVPDDKRSWHAGRSEFLGEKDVNTFSIGIEICNVGDGKEPYPEAQMQSIVRLVAWLSQAYNVPLASRLTRHRDVAIPLGRKRDTSDNFDHAYVAKAAQALLDGKRLPSYKAQRAPAGYDPRDQRHVVKAGESFASIAEDVYDAEAIGPAIAALNPGKGLVPGTVLALPTRY